MTKVGDTIYKFDENRRRYTKPAPGHQWGEIIWAEHFEPKKITGETKQSWLVSDYGHEIRVNKKTMLSAGRGGMSGHRWFTEDGKAGQLWLHEHGHKLRMLVGRATYEQMRQIADILGYGPVSND